jgi:hypothetical protein
MISNISNFKRNFILQTVGIKVVERIQNFEFIFNSLKQTIEKIKAELGNNLELVSDIKTACFYNCSNSLRKLYWQFNSAYMLDLIDFEVLKDLSRNNSTLFSSILT